MEDEINKDIENHEEIKDKRYSRLRALQKYGYDFDFEILRKKHVFIVGIGGIGSFASELLVRMGIGKLTILDLDVVKYENLNRVFYKEEHINKFKVEAASSMLKAINPDSKIVTYNVNLLSEDFEETLHEKIDSADLLLMGLDNIPSHQFFKVKTVKRNKPMVDCGVLRSGLGGYIHTIIPHQTACYACTGSVKFKTNDVKGPDCSASVPTTIAILSSLQVQTALKFLLKTGKIPDFLQYNALTDKFLEFNLQRDENCYVCGEGKKLEDDSFSEVELPPLEDLLKEIEKLKK